MRYIPVPDYHMHTPRCKHAIGDVREYAAAAVALGLKEIGMSDHSPMPNGFDAAWRMQRSELASYLDEVEAVRDRFTDKLTVRIGLEADFHPGTENYVRELTASYPWDYIIGSVHHIGEWGFDNENEISRWDGQDIEAAYCDYFDLIAQSARSGMFDIIGHPDLIKKFGHRPPAGSLRVREAEEKMLQNVRDANCALEISSAGLRKPVAEAYPHGRLIAHAAELGIPFSFGSDAHAPGQVGHAMQDCLAMLVSCGVKEISAFESRQLSSHPIQKER